MNRDCENDKFGKYKVGCRPSAQKDLLHSVKTISRERGGGFSIIGNAP